MYYGNDLEKKARYEELTELVNAAYAAVNACTAFADKHKLSFSFDVAYGMGGTYNPARDPNEVIPPRPRYGEDGYFEWYDAYGEDPGWSASSHSC